MPTAFNCLHDNADTMQIVTSIPFCATNIRLLLVHDLRYEHAVWALRHRYEAVKWKQLATDRHVDLHGTLVCRQWVSWQENWMPACLQIFLLGDSTTTKQFFFLNRGAWDLIFVMSESNRMPSLWDVEPQIFPNSIQSSFHVPFIENNFLQDGFR